MNNNILKNNLFRLVDPDSGAVGTKTLSAGTSDKTSEWVPIVGLGTIVFAVIFGAITSTGICNLGIDFSDDAATAVEETGISVNVTDADGSKVVLLEVTNPQYGYARLNIDRGTANSVINGVLFIGGLPADAPVTQHSTVSYTDLCQGIAN